MSLPNHKALSRLGVKARREFMERHARAIETEISSLRHCGAHWRAIDNARRRLRRVQQAADRFGVVVGQPSRGVNSRTSIGTHVRNLRKSVLDDPGLDPQPKPRIRVKAVSRRVPAGSVTSIGS